MTMFISVADERVQCAAVNEGGTGHRWPVRAGAGGRLGPSDVEQNIFPAAVYGADLCDLLSSIAPRPLLTTIENYSPGFNLAAEHIKKRYEQLGVPEKYATEEATDPHSWTPKLRLATTDWFCRWFYGRRGPTVEPKFQAEADATLDCTPNGSIRYSQQGQTIFSLMLRKQEQLPPPRKTPSSASDVAAFRAEMAAHGKYGQPCPRCGARFQRIRYASNETDYCPACQTGGRLLADRALSRLLREDWPRTPEELEALKRR